MERIPVGGGGQQADCRGDGLREDGGVVGEEDVKEVRAWLWTGRQTLVTHWRDVDSLR